MHTLTMRSDVSACGQRVGCASTVSRVTVFRSSTNSGLSASSTVSSSSAETCEGGETEEGSCTFPTEDTNATISMPYASFRYFSAIAPAATRPARSLDGARTSTWNGGAHRWSRARCCGRHRCSP